MNAGEKRTGISIVIPNLNGEKVLRLALLSLINQTFPKDMYEIIIVDNASTDNSLKAIERIARQYPNCSIKVIRLKKNIGYGKAINIGALNARFDLILASNNDIIFHPKYLENLFNVYHYAKKLDPRVVAAQGLHMYYPEVTCIYNAGGLVSILTGHYRFYGVCLTRDEFLKLMKRSSDGWKGFSYIAFPNGAGALIERDIFLRVGGYDSLYFSGIEEIDLGILLHLLGYRVILIPSAVMYHMESYTLGGRSVLTPRKLYLVLNGIFIYMLSLYDVAQLLEGLIIYILTLMSILFLSTLRRMKILAWVAVKTVRINMKMKKHILNRRGRIMKIRKRNLSEVFNYFKAINKYIELPKLLTITYSRFIRKT